MALPLKICAYLDALNFYYRYSCEYNFKWIDVHSLISERLREIGYQDIHLYVKVYTSDSVDLDARQRQQSYLATLKRVYGDRVQIIQGKHTKRKPRIEKQTDVNLAVDIVDDAHKKDYDLGVLVSGDTDFVGALKKANSLNYKMALITPHAKNQELQDLVCEQYSLIGFPKEMFLRHSLSIKAGDRGKPESWRG